MKLTRFTVDKKSITLLLFPQCLELSADDGLQLNCKVKQKKSDTQHFDNLFSNKIIVPANTIRIRLTLTQSILLVCENVIV